ncbi:hypothetical protein BpHYR1_051627 [Brachionus plicatilis]|uniref:Uncharacterized protein n=1 Tax=Brachionus plicatilis TaxID=10195 RepID=A0A3M7QZQ9_BRAPC|nr:hypothetical protein BpHYR1_051627 [Brachionus plicatilis]
MKKERRDLKAIPISLVDKRLCKEKAQMGTMRIIYNIMMNTSVTNGKSRSPRFWKEPHQSKKER